MDTQKMETPIDAVWLVRLIRDAHHEELREDLRRERLGVEPRQQTVEEVPNSASSHASVVLSAASYV